MNQYSENHDKTEFLTIYRLYLHDKTIAQTDQETVRDGGHNLLTYGCLFLLLDIGNSENREYKEHHAQTMKSTLLEEYPGIRWNSLLALRKAILNGSAILKGPSIGAIMQLLSPRVDRNYDPHKAGERDPYPEEIAHRADYINRFPDHRSNLDNRITMTQFLEMHPAGTFPALELMRQREQTINTLKSLEL